MSKPDDHRLLNILKQRTEDVNLKKHAVQWMEQCGSLIFTRNKLKELKTLVLNEIESLGGHVQLVALIEELDKQIDQN